MGRLTTSDREVMARFGVHIWTVERSDLNQREYCEVHGLSLKNFGNWRAQLKYEDTTTGPQGALAAPLDAWSYDQSYD